MRKKTLLHDIFFFFRQILLKDLNEKLLKHSYTECLYPWHAAGELGKSGADGPKALAWEAGQCKVVRSLF